ncbi:MAG: glycosyltransferase [Rhodospirillaceae bacterium]|nr:MAG: glycosyltransferase [Rhodospirillaceae bacterium]
MAKVSDTRLTVAILLCTHNGAKFIVPQLDSFHAQTYDGWRLWASDDASADATVDILRQYQVRWGTERLAILAGPATGASASSRPQSGASANFLSLVCNPQIQANAYAYADQDDVWESNKLIRALAWLKTIPAHIPALYCSRTRLMDEGGSDIGLSPLFNRHPPSFANALAQNIGGGNTMVFNAAARALLLEAGGSVTIVGHDWWTYQLVTGCGGQVLYDPYPTVRYRQHERQLVGSNVGVLARLSRAVLAFGGRFKSWTDINVRALERMRSRLTPENQRIFDLLHAARTGWLPGRLAALKKSGIHRQGFVDNVGLYIAVLLNRL